MTNHLRRSGIGAVGDIPWGTHFCHFYENKEDLLDLLVPYFKAGLEQNEYCIWSVFEPLEMEEAKQALERALPDAKGRIASGDIEIVPQSLCYRGDGTHEVRQLVRDWEAKLDKALTRGCDGMRVNVSAACPNPDTSEDAFTRLIANSRMIVLCAYPLPIGGATEVVRDQYSHRFATSRRSGDWQVVETPELRRARADVKRIDADLQQHIIQRDRELAIAEVDRRREVQALRTVEDALRVCGERSRCYFELGLVGMAIVSPTKGCLEVNDRLCDILGYERRELLQMPWAALAHPDDLAGDITNYDRVLTGEVDGYLMPKRWLRKNGDIVHTNVSVKCQRNQDRSVNYFAAMIDETIDSSSQVPKDLPPDTSDLSRREREVVRLIGSGMTVKEIAAALELSEKTISTYRSRVLTKLKLKTTAELIRFALKKHLVP